MKQYVMLHNVPHCLMNGPCEHFHMGEHNREWQWGILYKDEVGWMKVVIERSPLTALLRICTCSVQPYGGRVYPQTTSVCNQTTSNSNMLHEEFHLSVQTSQNWTFRTNIELVFHEGWTVQSVLSIWYAGYDAGDYIFLVELLNIIFNLIKV